MANANPAKVTWGPTTVFNTAQGAAAGNPAFGVPPSSTPTTGFGFSTNPVTSPAKSLFSPTQSPSTSAFGSTAATAPATAAAANNAFSQMLGAPQQAALQAHMNATMHQEASRLGTQLMQLHSAYSPLQTLPAQQNVSCRFQHIFYDPITQAQRLEKLLPNYPPKPTHVSDEIWHRALTQNPDPEGYIPVLVTSAEGLHSRLVAQQSKMKLHEKYLTQLDETLNRCEQFDKTIATKMDFYRSQNSQTRKRLLSIMQKFEICRGKNVPMQEAEKDAFNKLYQLSKAVSHVEQMHHEVQGDAEEYSRQWSLMQQERQRAGGVMLDVEYTNNAMSVLKESKDGIDQMVKTVKKGERDMEIVKRGAIAHQ